MVACGFSPSCVPQSLGGTLQPAERFAEWSRERLVLERIRYQHFADFESNPVTGAGVSTFLEKLINNSSIGKTVQEKCLEHRRSNLGFLSHQMKEQQDVGATIIPPPPHVGYVVETNDENQSIDQVDLIDHTRCKPPVVVKPNIDVAQTYGYQERPHAAALAKLVNEAVPLGETKQTVDGYDELGIQSSAPVIQETETIRHTARMAMGEALGLIPEAEKAAYLKALHHVPHLVESESNILHFVRRDNYKAYSAACRLVKYWKARVELFGEERAFLPMVQTGQGALTPDDVVILNCGVLALLPDDPQGRSVVMQDRNLLVDNDDVEVQQSKLRCFFYILSLLCENEINRDDGFVWLQAVITPRVRDIWREYYVRSLDILDCFPIRLKAVHLLVIPPKAVKKNLVKSIIGFTKDLFEGRIGERAISTRAASPADMAFELTKFGFEERSLPMALGGSWRYEDWMTFLRRRSQEEQVSFAINGGPVLPFAASTKEAPRLSDAEVKDRKRKLNTIHSRMKRERRRVEVSKLEEKCKEIEAANGALKADNRRLEILLEQAKRKVK